MKKKADTWMPVYVADYLADTAHLSTEQHGAYWLMLMAAWKRGGTLPNDDAQLAAVCRLPLARWKSHRSILLAFFVADGEVITHKRVAAEHANAIAMTQAKAKGGAEGAKKRWQKDGIPISMPLGEAMANRSQVDAPSPSHNPSGYSEPIGSGGPPPTDRDLVFSQGVPLLTAAGVSDRNARSMLANLSKLHGERAVLGALADTARERPGEPVAWLQALLKPKPRANQQEALEAANRAVAERFLAKEAAHAGQ